MRTVYSLNSNWFFSKTVTEAPAELPEQWEQICLPHTWNATDGQDGGNDYHRGTCWYARALCKQDLPAADRYYLEINGANSSADVYLNGKHMVHHDGGYSTWRVELTEDLQEENLLTVSARFGCRSYVIDPQQGFILNGEAYPLRGVSRHQDRLGIGNALLPEHHIEDMDLICEVGATTIRLAHY